MYLCLVIEIVCFKSFRTRTFVPELDSRLKENLRILEVNDQAPRFYLFCLPEYFFSLLYENVFCSFFSFPHVFGIDLYSF